MNRKLEGYETKLHDECEQLKDQIQNNKTPTNSSPARFSPKKSKEEYLGAVTELEKKFEGIRQEQITLSDNLNTQKSKFETSKNSLPASPGGGNASQARLEELQLMKLEGIIDQLTQNVSTLKTNISTDDSSTNFTNLVPVIFPFVFFNFIIVFELTNKL